ncbi:MAG: hypothetical protein GXP51_12315 [Deltaproteobacteria bacterium]|nr:hypothetical protein [Deltaproteobacteria bacterium]
MRHFLASVLLLFLVTLLGGCLSPRAESPAEKRSVINYMSQTTLTDLYRQRPSARENISRSDGYAVFSNINAQYLFIGGSGGYGVVVDKATGKKTYMKMAQVDLGLGFGLQDIRVVFVFHSPAALDSFINSGWEFGGRADLAARAEDRGASATGAVSISPEIDMYTLTKSGLIAKVNLSGSKYWKDEQLNQ